MSKAPKYDFSIEPVNSTPYICTILPKAKQVKRGNQYDIYYQLVFGILIDKYGLTDLLVSLQSAILELLLDNGKVGVEGQYLQSEFLLRERITYSLRQGHESSRKESIEGKVGSKSEIVPSSTADLTKGSETQATDSLGLDRGFESEVCNIRANYSPQKPCWFISPLNNQSHLFGSTKFTKFATIDISGLPSRLEYRLIVKPKDIKLLEGPVKKDMANSMNIPKFFEHILKRHYSKRLGESYKGSVCCDRR